MKERVKRTGLLVGEEGLQRLEKASVLVFGVGGVGGYAVEALVRAGIHRVDVVDADTVAESNLNRQIIATYETIGQLKVDAVYERAKTLNPDIEMHRYAMFYLPENAEEIDFQGYDYIIDAVDTVSAKLSIIERAKKAGIPVISAMGAGNKLSPSGFEICDLQKTHMCPLAKVMRKELKARGITGVKVCYSTEKALTPLPDSEQSGKRVTPGSTPYAPGICGLMLAGEVINDLLNVRTEEERQLPHR